MNKILNKFTLSEDTFKSFFENKTVAIVGNAESIFNKKDYGIDIDNHDIVIRINSGFIKNKLKQGNKTTIWASSFPLKEKNVVEEFNPEFIFWITPKLSVKPNYSVDFHKKMFIFPKKKWIELYELLSETRPTTGISIIYFITKYCNAKKISLYGFDFFETKSFYLDKIRLDTPHDFNKEKYFVENLLLINKNIYLKKNDI